MTEQQTQKCATVLANAIAALNKASYWLQDLAEERTTNRALLADIRYLHERCMEVEDQCLAVTKEEAT